MLYTHTQFSILERSLICNIYFGRDTRSLSTSHYSIYNHNIIIYFTRAYKQICLQGPNKIFYTKIYRPSHDFFFEIVPLYLVYFL